jgi:hypothetical protein
MSAPCRDLFESANLGIRQTASKNPPSGNSVITLVMRRLLDAVKAVARTKPAMWLAHLCDLSPAQAYRVATGEQNFSGPVVCHLLRSEHGYQFLQAIMDGSDAAWWRDVSQERELTAIKQQRRALDRRLRQIEEA